MKKSRGELIQVIISLLRDKQRDLHNDWKYHAASSLNLWADSSQFQEYEAIQYEIDQYWIEEYNNA